jgi:hypothetical protein
MSIPIRIRSDALGVSGGTGCSGTITVDASCTLLVVFDIQLKDPNLPTSQAVTIAGSAMTLLQSVDNGSMIIKAFYKVNPTTGSQTLAETHTNNALTRLYAIQYSGLGATPVATGATATGTSTGPSVNVTGSLNYYEILDAVAWNDASATASVGGGQTQLINNSPSYDLGAASSIETGTGTITMSWTLSASKPWVESAIIVIGTPGGAQVIMF